MSDNHADAAPVAVRIWDLPTRSFHWLLAACVLASVLSAKVGGNALVWHFRLGYLVLTLLAFRLLWGFLGGRWSRFSAFVYAPSELLRYLRGKPRSGDAFEIGHSPLGALSVFALLGVLAAQVATGLFADDEIASTGPLIRYVSGATSLLLTKWHKGWGQGLILGLVALHVAAILFHLLRRRHNLVGPMWKGDKALPPGTPASADGGGRRLLALLLLAACATATAWLASLGN